MNAVFMAVFHSTLTSYCVVLNSAFKVILKRSGAASKERSRGSAKSTPKSKGKRPTVENDASPVEVGQEISSDSSIGKLLSSIAGPIGKSLPGLAAKAGNWFSNILGLGDYEVKENSVVDSIKTGVEPPVMHSTKDSVVVRHREYIGDLNSAIDFTANVFAINPGLSSSFPWLSALAQNYEQYRWRGLVFEYKTTSSSVIAAASPAMGACILASQYNIYSPIFANKQQMDNHMWTTSGRPCDTFVHPIECDPSVTSYNNYYVRSGPVPEGQDVRLYDMFYLTYASIGSQSVYSTGELWATYEVELFKPVCRSALDLTGKTAFYFLDSIVTPVFVTQSPTKKYDSIGMSFSNDGAFCYFKFPIGSQGDYFFKLTGGGSGGDMGVSTFDTALQNISSIGWGYTGDAHATTGYGNTKSALVSEYYHYMRINNPNVQAWIRINSGQLTSWFGTLTSKNIYFMFNQFNGNIMGTTSPLLSSIARDLVLPSLMKPTIPEDDDELKLDNDYVSRFSSLKLRRP